MFVHYLSPLIITISLIFFTLPEYHANDTQYDDCNRPLKCGENYQEFKFPFWGENRPLRCGLAGFEIKCVNNDFTAIDIGSDHIFRLLGINDSTREIRLARDYTPTEFCPKDIENNKLNEALFYYNPFTTEHLQMLHNCSSSQLGNITIDSIRGSENVTCNGDWIADSRVFGNKSFSEAQIRELESCDSRMRVLVNVTTLEEFRYTKNMSLQQVLNQNFVVKYKIIYNETVCSACVNSGGLCWSGTVLSPATCLCRDGISRGQCRNGGSFHFCSLL